MRVLIIKPSSLGDIICALPVAESIRRQCPSTTVSWVVKERFADIVRRCSTVNGDVILFRHQNGWRGANGFIRTIQDIRRYEFDAVLDFQGLLRSGVMTLASRSRVKVGSPYSREGSRYACTHLAAPLEDGFESHAVDRMLSFLPCIGLQPELRNPVDIRGESPDQLDGRLRGSCPIVMIPNSRGAHKEWPGFPELTRSLNAAFPEIPIVWDSHLRWQDPELQHPESFINLTSRSSLLQLVELLRRARLVIANDSGPLHMAAALGRPLLGLFGPTLPQRSGPYPLHESRNSVLQAAAGDLSRLPNEIVLNRVCEILRQQPVQRRSA